MSANLLVRTPNKFLLEVSRGNIPGMSVEHKFGRNSAVSTTLVPVCDGGNYQMPTTAQTLEAVSTSASDTVAGVGMRTLTVIGLDASCNLQTVTVDMNGTTPVVLPSTFSRVFRLYAGESGRYATQSSSSQVGAVTLRTSGGGATWATLPLVNGSFGVSQSLIGCYTVPAGKTAYILSAILTVDSNKSADLFFFSRTNIDNTTAPFDPLRIKNAYTGLVGTEEIVHLSNESYPEKTDIGFFATAPTAADVSVEFEMLLVDN